MKVELSGFFDEMSPRLDEQLSECHKFGISHLCPRTVDDKNIADYTFEEFQRDLEPRLKVAGVSFSSIGSPIGKIAWDDEAAFQKQKKQLGQLVKIAQEMACPYIRVFAFYVKDDAKEKAYPTILSKMKEFLQIAHGSGVKLLLENEKEVYGSHPQEILRLKQELADSDLCLCFDASNYIQCGDNALEAFHLLKKEISYFHLKDCSKWGVEVPFGLGEAHYETIFAELKAMNYQGFMTLEPHLFWYADDKKKVYAKPFAFLSDAKRYRAFRFIDRKMHVSFFRAVSRKEAFEWDVIRVKEALKGLGE